MPADVRDIIQFFLANDIAYYLESNSGLFGSQFYAEKIYETILAYTQGNLKKVADLTEKSRWFCDLIDSFADQAIDYADVNKISFINTDFDYQAIADKFGDKFEMFHMTVPFLARKVVKLPSRAMINRQRLTSSLTNLA
jgi:hypothetical protein